MLNFEGCISSGCIRPRYGLPQVSWIYWIPHDADGKSDPNIFPEMVGFYGVKRFDDDFLW